MIVHVFLTIIVALGLAGVIRWTRDYQSWGHIPLALRKLRTYGECINPELSSSVLPHPPESKGHMCFKTVATLSVLFLLYGITAGVGMWYYGYQNMLLIQGSLLLTTLLAYVILVNQFKFYDENQSMSIVLSIIHHKTLHGRDLKTEEAKA